MKQQQKWFPFFRVPLLNALGTNLKQMDDFVVLVRVTPHITVSNYLESVLFLFMFLDALFAMICVFLSYALSNIPLRLFAVIWQHWWLMLRSTFTGTPLPSSLQGASALFWLSVALGAGTLWIFAQCKRAVRELRGLREMHTMTAEQRTAFSLQRFLRVTLPAWLLPSVNYEPTAEELLTLLREREQATEGQTQAMISTLMSEARGSDEEQQESPSINMLLTLTHQVTLSLLEPGGKQVTLRFTHALAPLMGFLATYEQGSWVSKERIFQQLYKKGQESRFAMHRQRINELIMSHAREAGFFPESEDDLPAQTVLESSSSEHEEEEDGEQEQGADDVPTAAKEDVRGPMDLLENQVKGQTSSWRLIPSCQIDLFPFLSAFYPKVVRAQAQALAEAPCVLSLQEVRQGYHHLIEEYGEGFLATHMKKGDIWPWTIPLYRKYREQCLFILSYATEREREYLQHIQQAKEPAVRKGQYDILESIAQLYGWRAMIATGLDLKQGGRPGDQDMEHCLSYYELLGKHAAARASYRHYCDLRSRLDPAYEPSEALAKRAEEVLSRSKTKKASSSRKTTRDAG